MKERRGERGMRGKEEDEDQLRYWIGELEKVREVLYH